MGVRPGRGYQRQPVSTRQLGERRVPAVGQRFKGVGQLDDHAIGAEPVDQRAQRRIPGVEIEVAVARLQRGPDRSLATAREHHPICARGGYLVDVVDRAPLAASSQLSLPDHPRERGIARLTPSKNQQMLPDRVGHSLPGADRALGRCPCRHATNPEFGAEDRAQPGAARGLCESDRAVESVVIGQRQTGQLQTSRLSRHLLRSAGPVEEAEVRVRVEFAERGWHRHSIEHTFESVQSGGGS